MFEWVYRDVRWRKGTRPYVLARDGYRCQVRLTGCTIRATEADHVPPLAEDPSDPFNPARCRAVCKPCNSRLGRAVLTKRNRSRSAAEYVWEF